MRIFCLTIILIAIVLSWARDAVSGDGDRAAELLPLEQRGLYQHYELTKSEYLVAEPIYLYTWIENRSKQIQHYKVTDWLKFTVFNIDGSSLSLRCGWLHSSPDELPIINISADSSSSPYVDNVLNYFGKNRSCVDNYLDPGKYFLCSDLMPSDTVEFTVVEPTQSTDKLVAERLIEYLSSDRLLRLSGKEKVAFYEQLLTDFPRNAYTPHLLCELIIKKSVIEGSRENLEIRKYGLDLLMNYRATPSTRQALFELTISDLPSSMRGAVRSRLTVLADTLIDGVSRENIDRLLKELAQ